MHAALNPSFYFAVIAVVWLLSVATALYMYVVWPQDLYRHMGQRWQLISRWTDSIWTDRQKHTFIVALVAVHVQYEPRIATGACDSGAINLFSTLLAVSHTV